MIRWNTAFIDRPAEGFDAAGAFWARVTGARLSERRGERGEFATLLPESGDPCLRIQAVGGPGGAHLDLDVDDPESARRAALSHGASLVAAHDDWTVLRSPRGVVFCLTVEDGEQAPPAVPSPDGALSRLDQICLDIGPAGFDDEVRFWSAFTGWGLTPTTDPEFARLAVPSRLPIRILLQRLNEDRPPSAHLDMACSDVDAVVAWHERLGARRVGGGRAWAVMSDPAGGTYCLTSRDPHTSRVTE
ncbi:VOC family protein [Nocardia sp. NEAU-G5]|uniref:VOC family protein n=1 Tax=Nocardia albiluteola TaxID=2842303 RepID=A0ABS6B718_9NOCA|nr:VOC family protein [Nocardia albiluteola]MBU3065933.1 VOC family protein [Nocardia albiluteola]